MTIADIQTLTRFLCDADTTSYTAANLLITTNDAYQIVVGWIINGDGTWNFDDTNYTDHPRGTFTLVEGQEDYSFNPQTAGPYSSHFLDIEAVEILNTASPAIYVRIHPMDHQQLGGVSPEEYFGVTSAGNPQVGFPLWYDKNGNTIRLYPAPTSTHVTLAAGLRVWFKRNADLFTSAQVTTGTKEPGFAAQFHGILSYLAAIPYCENYKKDRVPLFKLKVEEMRRDLIKFYGHREADVRKVMTMKAVQYR